MRNRSHERGEKGHERPHVVKVTDWVPHVVKVMDWVPHVVKVTDWVTHVVKVTDGCHTLSR